MFKDICAGNKKTTEPDLTQTRCAQLPLNLPKRPSSFALIWTVSLRAPNARFAF